MEYELRIHDDPGEAVGLYLSLLNSSIDGAQFYLGLQTNLARPGQGFVGKGLLFSTWGTFDAADTRTAPGGYLELGTHEGRFAGVRLPYPWTVGEYRLRLTRSADGDASGDWFEFFITDVKTSNETFLGALRFRRSEATTPATISPNHISFLEVYSAATDYGAVPAWHVSLAATANGAQPTSASSEYPAFPTAEYPNADVWFDSADRRVHMSFAPRCHAAGPLFPP